MKDNDDPDPSISSEIIIRRRSTILEIKENLWFAKIIIKHPCRIILGYLVLVILVLIPDYFGFQFSGVDETAYFIKGNTEVDKLMAVRLAQTTLFEIIDDKTPVQTQNDNTLDVIVMFKAKNNNDLLDMENLEFIHEITNKIKNSNKEEYGKLCLKSMTDNTWPGCSIESEWNPLINEYYLNNQNGSDWDLNVWLYSIINDYPDSIRNLYLNSFGLELSNTLTSQYYRAFYRFGLPYPNIDTNTSSYSSKNDRFEEQLKYYDKFIIPIYRDIQLKTYDNIEVVIFGLRIRDIEIGRLLATAALFTILSIITVVVFIWIHANSLYLAIGAIIQIVLAFPLSFFIYRWIFQITYFDGVSLAVIFIMLGIGADDVFVFIDAWRQSIPFVGYNLEARMTFTFKRASKAMFVTTITTFFAFVATTFSKLMPLKAFGFWASILVTMNYILVITLFPAILSYWHQNVKEREKCCCKWKKSDKDEQSEKMVNVNNDTDDPETLLLQSEGSCIEIFCRDTWYEFINLNKWIFITAWIGIIIVAIYKGSQIGSLDERERFNSKDHYLEKMFDMQQEFYGGVGNEKTEVIIAWGIEPHLDTSRNYKYWDPDMHGITPFNPGFDLSPAKAQQHIFNICNEIISDFSDDLHQSNNYFSCFMNDLKNYGESLGYTFPFIFNSDPVTQKELFIDFIEKWVNEDSIGQRYLQSGIIGYNSKIRKLKYIKILFKIDVGIYDPYWIKDIERNKWQSRVDTWNKYATMHDINGVSKGIQTSAFSWGFGVASKEFVDSAIFGTLVALPLAFVALLISTQNIIIAVFASLSIVGVMATELSLFVIRGWNIGVIVSLTLVIMIGFSVDYVVHLGNAYIECKISEKREIRVRWSLYTMTGSVLFGGVTTFGAACWLMVPNMESYRTFGFSILTIVVINLCFAFIFFISLLTACGPHGNCGNIPIQYLKCNKECLNKKDKSDDSIMLSTLKMIKDDDKDDKDLNIIFDEMIKRRNNSMF